MTYTFAELEVSEVVFHEIASKLKAAGHDHVFHEDGKLIDMHGIALKSVDKTHRVEGKRNDE